MDPLPRKRFLAYAAGARLRPGFDAEREARLTVAAALREALAAGAPAELLAVLRGDQARRVSVIGEKRVDWLEQRLGASADEVTASLTCFLDPDIDPVERMARFAAATGDNDDPLVIGSVLNFATDPSSLPAVAPRPFEWLADTLGWSGPGPADSVADRYSRHVAFAREVAALLEGTGVGDMLDVELVIRSAFRHGRFWAEDPESVEPIEAVELAERPPQSARPYLSICAIYLDEAPYLREWIEFHRLVGVERFFLYDHGSADEHREVLEPYEEQGSVVRHEWPGKGQVPGYNNCLAAHRRDSRWIAFIDLDEFLFSPTGKPLPAVLRQFEQFPGVGANWVNFGTGGRKEKPAGLVTASYLYRTVDAGGEQTFKSIVDPNRSVACIHPHAFRFSEGRAVDEQRQPIEEGAATTETASHRLLRINHYATKSEQEFERKRLRGRADTGVVRPPRQPPTGELRDEAITAYLPALRKALGMRD